MTAPPPLESEIVLSYDDGEVVCTEVAGSSPAESSPELAVICRSGCHQRSCISLLAAEELLMG